jgi:hypothetical protein
MGALLSLLNDDSKVFLDFDNCQPTAAQAALHSEVGQTVNRFPTIIHSIDTYAGCAAAIQKALNTPSQESEEAAFQAVAKNVLVIKEFYTVSEALSQVLPRLLTDLMAPPAAASSSKDAEKAVEHHMSDKAACVKQIGLILDFALKFDGIKMMKSQIQNDFSYYRRSMGKRDFSELCVSSEDANFISLFLAASSPMVEMLKKCVKTASDQNEGVLLVLAAFANICCSMVANNSSKLSLDTQGFCLRAAAGAIVIFDLVDPNGGAFRKKSPINIKRCCQILTSSSIDGVKAAVNAVRYSTKHFDESETPDAIKEMFE